MRITGQVYEDRLKRLSVENKDNGCLEWIGSTTRGYGRLSVEGRTIGAHRLSYMVFVGEIPDGLFVCHKCDNRKCINPDHLFLGTHKDNMDDREAKGRNKFPAYKHEQHHNAKLNWKMVNEIRLSQGKTRISLANEYGVSRDAIRDVLTNRTWIHKPPTISGDE